MAKHPPTGQHGKSPPVGVVDDPQMPFLRLAMGHARCLAHSLELPPDATEAWLTTGLSRYPLALARAMPARAAQCFWRAMLGGEMPVTVAARRPTTPRGNRSNRFDALLAELDPIARAVFLLRVWHDFDDALLADLLGLREGQARVGVMRAFGLMRARLQDAGDLGADAWMAALRARLGVLSAAQSEAEQASDKQRIQHLLGVRELTPVASAPSKAPIEPALSQSATSAAVATLAAEPFPAESADPVEVLLAVDAAVPDAAEPIAHAIQQAQPLWPQRAGQRRRYWLFGALLLPLGVALWTWGLRDTFITAPPTATPDMRPSSPPNPVATSRSMPPVVLSTQAVESVLASPDLALLRGPLTPQQLAVLDQLRWWQGQTAGADEPAPSASATTTTARSGPESTPAGVAAVADFERLAAADARLLHGFARLWPQLQAEQRQTLLDNARQWRSMSAEQRAQAVTRAQSLAELPAEVRARTREHFALWSALSMGARLRLIQTYVAFAALAPEQQRSVAEAFARLPPSEQTRWRLVPGDRALLALASRVFSYVPQHERDATLDMLAALSNDDRDRLRLGSRRMAAWQREQLRQDLLAQPAQDRSAWLQQRFGH